MQFSWEKQNGVLSFAIATPPVFVYGNTARQITLNITDNGQPYIASGVWSILMSIRNPQEFSGVPLAEATTFTAGFPFGVYTASIDLYTTELEAYMSNQAQRGGLLQFTLTLPDGTTSSMAIPCSIQNYTANPNAGTPTNLPDAEAWLTARAVRYDIVQTLSAPEQAQARSNIGAGVGGGSVTSVGMTVPSFLSVAGSPVTTSGSLDVTLANQNANLIFAGPNAGAAATPTFRSLVTNDLPDTAVSANTYAVATITVDAKGRITSANVTTEFATLNLSDLISDLVVGTFLNYFRAPFPLVWSQIPRINTATAPTGSAAVVDVLKNGASVMATKISIDAGSTTSVGAATPAVFSDTTVADNDIISFNLDQVGSTNPGTGLEITMYYRRA